MINRFEVLFGLIEYDHTGYWQDKFNFEEKSGFIVLTGKMGQDLLQRSITVINNQALFAATHFNRQSGHESNHDTYNRPAGRFAS